MSRVEARNHAQAIAWFVVTLPLFLSAIGLAVDGETVLRAHRRAQGAADGAARTGATQVQIGHSRAEPGAPQPTRYNRGARGRCQLRRAGLP
jgi:uncharacterized membrane protein